MDLSFGLRFGGFRQLVDGDIHGSALRVELWWYGYCATHQGKVCLCEITLSSGNSCAAPKNFLLPF
jgi:hypothetical protein